MARQRKLTQHFWKVPTGSKQESLFPRRRLLIGLAAGLGVAAVGSAGVAHAVPPIRNDRFVNGGGANFNVWPSGDPGGNTDAFNLQWALDNVRDQGFVRIKDHDKETGAFLALNIGPNTVQIRDEKSVTLIGSGEYGKPVIRGSCSNALWGAVSAADYNSGVFHVVAPGQNVVFNNLSIEHRFSPSFDLEDYTPTLVNRGISLGFDSEFLHGPNTASCAQVCGNDYSGQTATIAKLYLAGGSTENTVVELTLECDDIVNGGEDNEITGTEICRTFRGPHPRRGLGRRSYLRALPVLKPPWW